MPPAAGSLLELTQEEALYWLALRMTPGLGTRKAGQLIEIFRSPRAVLRASRSELEAAGLGAAVAQSLASGCAFEDAASQQEKLAEAGATLVPVTDSRYPPLLRDIYDAPPLLFVPGTDRVAGNPDDRRGGHAPPDSVWHHCGRAALQGVGRGRDPESTRHGARPRYGSAAGGAQPRERHHRRAQVYPAENRKLAEEIASRGLVISEFPMGAPPYPQNFPVRNRVISGISAGVLVVEGSEYSGSAITAKLAAEQNREVFAVPGNITQKTSWGPNLLIKQGAKLVQEWNDVVVELKPELRRRLVEQCRNRMQISTVDSTETSAEGSASVRFGPMCGAAQAVLRVLQPDSPMGLDHLIEAVEGSSPSEIIAILFELELGGMVRQLPGKNFIKVWAE